MTTEPITTGGAGRGWPDPTEPGVPAEALHDGYHWLVDPAGGEAIAGQWSPDAWSWMLSRVLERLGPKEMSYMDYLGGCLSIGHSRPPR
jgi:hypothetical protein